MMAKKLNNALESSAWDLNFYNNNFDKTPNIKLTYDGETNEFKDVEKRSNAQPFT